MYGLAGPENGLSVLYLADCGIRDHFTFMKPLQVSINKWTKLKSRADGARRRKACFRAAEKGSEAPHVRRAHVDELTAESSSLAAETEQAKSERDTLAARVCKLQVASAKPAEMLGVVVPALQLLKGHVTVGENRAITAEVWIRKMLDKMSHLRALVEGQN